VRGVFDDRHPPFGGELEDYRTTFSELRELVDAVVTRLAAESLGDQR